MNPQVTGFFDEARFFRVVPDFIAQFGLNGDRRTNERWAKRPIPDDSARQRNLRGTIVFTSTGPDTRSHQMFINLVDNAVEALGGSQASPGPGGDRPTIVVETRRDGVNGVARIIVADNGPGIPPADREKLFMPYYSTKRRGSGLGLAIVRRIVAEHGGSIDVADNVPHGTRFSIELPA